MKDLEGTGFTEEMFLSPENNEETISEEFRHIQFNHPNYWWVFLSLKHGKVFNQFGKILGGVEVLIGAEYVVEYKGPVHWWVQHEKAVFTEDEIPIFEQKIINYNMSLNYETDLKAAKALQKDLRKLLNTHRFTVETKHMIAQRLNGAMVDVIDVLSDVAPGPNQIKLPIDESGD